MSDGADDPLSVPLSVGTAEGGRGWRRVLLFVVIALPLLPLLLLLLPLLPLLALAGLGGAYVLWPAHVRGLPRDVRFVIRLVRATRQLNGRLKRTGGAFTAADYWEETVGRHADREV